MQMFPGELLSPWERWSWHKNQVTLFSENTTWGLTAWPQPVSDPCGKEGMSGGLLLSQHRLILQEGCVLLTAGFHLGFPCLLVPRYCPQIIIDHPQDQVSAMDLTPALCRAFPLDWAILSFSRQNPRQAEGILVFCGEIQISFAGFHFSHFRKWTSSQGVRAVSKLSSLLEHQ